MAEKSVSKTWSSNYLFLLASIGSTVGLSNIWRFTYLAGENGGGAFVIIYIISLIVMGIPILAAELMIGRRGGRLVKWQGYKLKYKVVIANMTPTSKKADMVLKE